MDTVLGALVKILLAAGSWEGYWWARRLDDRKTLYDRALSHARYLGVPLIVVGAPDRGATAGPGCGDLVIDIEPSQSPNFLQADITKPLPIPSNAAVVFVSCVLEYVGDFDAAWHELQRIAPGRVYVCRVAPWTLSAYLYPGAKRVVDGRICDPIDLSEALARREAYMRPVRAEERGLRQPRALSAR